MSITLQDLRKSFGGKPAIDGITLDIAAGEFFAIVGASGCGKSTLLRLIAGLEAADAGTIRLGGRQVSGPRLHVPPEERGTGFVFQSYALWPHLNVRGNVAFPAQAAGFSKADAMERAERHLGTVELTDFANRKPADLSGGQRQRVALAHCLAQEAEVILMDEPLANLDPHLRATMEEELTAFHRASGATTVYITHDQREAMAVADRMAVMAQGRFLQVGAPADIYDRPSCAAVARFIGQGAIQPVTIQDDLAELAGQPVHLRGAEKVQGAHQALFRPSDLAVVKPGAGLSARVISALYRGGMWETKLSVAGLPEAFVAHLPAPTQSGDAVGLRVLGGWVLPG
jgi:iron(III) transport system ATP-binding protein